MDEEFLGPKVKDYSQVLESLGPYELEDYKRRRDAVRWETAWEIFDTLNQGQGLDTKFEINLNLLDLEEAQAISKQIIFDIAESAKNEVIQLNLPQSRNHVLAILCADSHFEAAAGGGDDTYGDSEDRQAPGTPFTQVSEDVSENNAFPLQRSADGSRISRGLKGKVTPRKRRPPANLLLKMIAREL